MSSENPKPAKDKLEPNFFSIPNKEEFDVIRKMYAKETDEAKKAALIVRAEKLIRVLGLPDDPAAPFVFAEKVMEDMQKKDELEQLEKSSQNQKSAKNEVESDSKDDETFTAFVAEIKLKHEKEVEKLYDVRKKVREQLNEAIKQDRKVNLKLGLSSQNQESDEDELDEDEENSTADSSFSTGTMDLFKGMSEDELDTEDVRSLEEVIAEDENGIIKAGRDLLKADNETLADKNDEVFKRLEDLTKKMDSMNPYSEIDQLNAQIELFEEDIVETAMQAAMQDDEVERLKYENSRLKDKLKKSLIEVKVLENTLTCQKIGDYDKAQEVMKARDEAEFLKGQLCYAQAQVTSLKKDSEFHKFQIMSLEHLLMTYSGSQKPVGAQAQATGLAQADVTGSKKASETENYKFRGSETPLVYYSSSQQDHKAQAQAQATDLAQTDVTGSKAAPEAQKFHPIGPETPLLYYSGFQKHVEAQAQATGLKKASETENSKLRWSETPLVYYSVSQQDHKAQPEVTGSKKASEAQNFGFKGPETLMFQPMNAQAQATGLVQAQATDFASNQFRPDTPWMFYSSSEQTIESRELDKARAKIRCLTQDLEKAQACIMSKDQACDMLRAEFQAFKAGLAQSASLDPHQIAFKCLEMTNAARESLHNEILGLKWKILEMKHEIKELKAKNGAQESKNEPKKEEDIDSNERSSDMPPLVMIQN